MALSARFVRSQLTIFKHIVSNLSLEATRRGQNKIGEIMHDRHKERVVVHEHSFENFNAVTRDDTAMCFICTAAATPRERLSMPKASPRRSRRPRVCACSRLHTVWHRSTPSLPRLRILSKPICIFSIKAFLRARSPFAVKARGADSAMRFALSFASSGCRCPRALLPSPHGPI